MQSRMETVTMTIDWLAILTKQLNSKMRLQAIGMIDFDVRWIYSFTAPFFQCIFSNYFQSHFVRTDIHQSQQIECAFPQSEADVWIFVMIK